MVIFSVLGVIFVAKNIANNYFCQFLFLRFDKARNVKIKILENENPQK